MISEGDGSPLIAAAERASARPAPAPEPALAAGSIGSLVSAIVGDRAADAAAPARTEQEPTPKPSVPKPSVPKPDVPAAALPADHLRPRMRGAVGDRLYDTWLAGAEIEDGAEGLTITARTPFAAGWIEKNLVATLRPALGREDLRVRTAAA